MKTPIDWLLESNQPAIRYRTLLDVLDRPSSDEEVRRTFAQVTQGGWAAEILKGQLPGFRVGGTWQYQGYWHNYVLLNRPKYVATVWKFLVLTDLGLTAKNNQVMKTCKLLSDRYLKSKENYHLCMTANITRTFLQAGFDENNRVRNALNWLVDVQKDDGGWHCFESSRGTLDCWEPLSAFAALPKNQRSRRITKSIERGAEFYLKRKLFREGVRIYPPWFRFHYPVHYYYDLLVGLEVLSSLGYGKDPRMKFALELLQKKKRADGRWLLGAVNPDIPKNFPKASYSSSPPFEPFPAIQFALERVGKPSKSITLRAIKVLKNVEIAV